ncbi:hypothetical protein ACLBWZ_14335 [Brucellaceae bacterium C25G]
MANCANITRRSIFKLAPAAVLAAGGAIAIFPTQLLASEPVQADNLREEVMQLWGQLSVDQKRNVLEFLRRAQAASTEISN